MSENFKLEAGLGILREQLLSAHGSKSGKHRSRSAIRSCSQKSLGKMIKIDNLPSVRREKELLGKNMSPSPQGISRDVSFRQETYWTSKNKIKSDTKTLLQTIQGDSEKKIFEGYFLPLDIEQVEKMAGENCQADQFDISQQKFLLQCENLKKKATRYMQSRTYNVKNEGGYLFKTQTGLIQAHLPKFYKLINNEKSQQCTNTFKALNNISDGTRAPSGRREVELLIQWLDYMLYKYTVQIQPQSLDQKVRVTQLIYSLCYKELTRQVSVHCIERGALLEKIWTAQVDLHSEHEDHLLAVVDKLKKRLQEILTENKTKFDRELDKKDQVMQKLRKQLNWRKKKIKELETEAFQLNDQIVQLQSKNAELRQTVELISKTDAFVKEQLKRSQQYQAESYQSCFNANTQTFEEDFPPPDVAEEDKFDQQNFEALIDKRAKPVVLFGYFDRLNVFHRTKMMERQNRFSKIEITDFADDILEIGQTRNKWTNTTEDEENQWKFIKQAELQFLQDRAIMVKDYESLSISTSSFYQIQKEKSLKFSTLIGLFTVLRASRNVIKDDKKIQCNPFCMIKYTQTDPYQEPVQKRKVSKLIQRCMPVEIKPPVEIIPQKVEQVKKEIQSPVKKQSFSLQNLKKTTEKLIKPLFANRNNREQPAPSKPIINLIKTQGQFIIDIIPASLQQDNVYHYIQNLKIIAEQISQKGQELKTLKQFPNLKLQNQQTYDFIKQLRSYIDKVNPQLYEGIRILSKLHNIVPDNIGYEPVIFDTTLSDHTKEYLDTDEQYPGELKRKAKIFSQAISQNWSTDIQSPVYSELIAHQAIKLKNSIDSVFSHVQKVMKEQETQTDTQKETLVGPYAKRILSYSIEEILDIDYHPSQEFKQYIERISLSLFQHQQLAIQQYIGSEYAPRSNLIYIKPLMKLINRCYMEKIIKCSENSNNYKLSIIEILQELLVQTYGLKNVVDDNISRVIKGVQHYMEKYHRVLIFARFLGLTMQKYTVEDFNFYINCVEFIWLSNQGNNFYNEDSATSNLSGYQRVLNCAEIYFKDKLTDFLWNQFYKSLEALKNEQGKIVTIDTDFALEIFLNYYKQLKNQLSDYLIKKLGKDYKMYSLLLRNEFIGIIQPFPLCKMTQQQLSNIFKIHATVIDESKLAIRWETLLSIILDNSMVTINELF